MHCSVSSVIYNVYYCIYVLANLLTPYAYNFWYIILNIKCMCVISSAEEIVEKMHLILEGSSGSTASDHRQRKSSKN